MRSGGVTCPTRSAPVVINGVFALSFDVLAVCSGNERSISLTNMQFDPAVPYTIHVYRKNTSIEVNGFPLTIGSSDPSFITRSILLDYNTYTFLQSPDEYQIQLEQFQVSAVCIITSSLVDYRVLPPLFATVVETTQSPSDIDIGTITLEITAGTGAPEYSTSIKLDSAAAFTQFYEDEHLTVAQDVDGRYIDRYEDVPAGRYEVIVTDADGCFLELVPPARVKLDTRIIIPNVFTPNADDVNDTFYIRNLPETGNQLIITNRWGNQVFTSSDYNRTNFWNGEGVVDGTYFYNLKVQTGDVYTGWVEIMRGKKP
jgi:gliding motility-associated-like protein